MGLLHEKSCVHLWVASLRRFVAACAESAALYIGADFLIVNRNGCRKVDYEHEPGEIGRGFARH